MWYVNTLRKNKVTRKSAIFYSMLVTWLQVMVVQMCGWYDLFDVAALTLQKMPRSYLQITWTMAIVGSLPCQVSVVTERVFLRGDQKVTWSRCCCRNRELDTAVDIGLLGKWSDTSNGERSNIYLRLFFGPAWQRGNSRGSSRMALGLSLSRLPWVKLRGMTLLKSIDDKTSVVMISEQVHFGAKRLNSP